MPQLMRDGFYRPDNHFDALWALRHRAGCSLAQRISVDDCVPRDEIIKGPCETRAGRLARDEYLMHPDTAAALAAEQLAPAPPENILTLSKEPTVASDIETKRFTRQRVEYWVPTGTYDGDGARIEDINLATVWATHELNKRGVIKQGDSYEGHIRIKPHDEHVIIYIEFDEEQKK